MSPRRPDPVALVAGLAFLLLGGVVLLDTTGAAGDRDALTLTAVIPVGLAIAGGLLLWQRRSAPRALFGAALVVGAAVLFLAAIGALDTAGNAVVVAAVAILALCLILAPFLWGMGRNLAAERAERIRSQERAELSAHLHDSVLQSLALIQRRAGDPREVAALARRQERELRSWLQGAGSYDERSGVAAALKAAAERVEDDHRVRVDVVTVGEREMDEATDALVAAARETLVNAAKFAADSGEPISLYAEIGGEGHVDVWVRDRGAGFDLDSIPEDRRGIRESVVGRMTRQGGSANIRSREGEGTEVHLSLPGRR